MTKQEDDMGGRDTVGDSRLIGEIKEGMSWMKEAVTELRKKVELHGEDLARGERNFEIISSDVKEIKDGMKETNSKVDGLAASMTKLVTEFKECRKAKLISDKCDIHPNDSDKPSIIINVPKLDLSFMKNPLPYVIVVLLVLAALGVKFHPALMSALSSLCGA